MTPFYKVKLCFETSKAEKITVMAEAGYSDTPGHYNLPSQDVFKKRSMSIRFDSTKTKRLEPIKKTDSTDFFEISNAAKLTVAKAPAIGFLKGPKKSFAEEMAKVQIKNPGVGTYKISDRAYKMLSPSPNGRKR